LLHLRLLHPVLSQGTLVLRSTRLLDVICLPLGDLVVLFLRATASCGYLHLRPYCSVEGYTRSSMDRSCCNSNPSSRRSFCRHYSAVRRSFAVGQRGPRPYTGSTEGHRRPRTVAMVDGGGSGRCGGVSPVSAASSGRNTCRSEDGCSWRKGDWCSRRR
jgi:hypothetical protein